MRVRRLVKALPVVGPLAKRAARRFRPPHVRSAYGPLLQRRDGDGTYAICRDGGYGRFTADIVEAEAPPFVLLDIGANLGIFSLLAERNPRCLAAFAFEAVPATFHYLLGNLAANGCRKVVPICGAVSDGEGPSVLSMTVDPGHSGTSRITGGDGAVATLAVRRPHLEELVARAPTDVPIAVKLDVEGAELPVLGSLAAADFFPRIDRMVVEVAYGPGGAPREPALPARLAELGFREQARGDKPEWRYYDALYVRAG